MHPYYYMRWVLRLRRNCRHFQGHKSYAVCCLIPTLHAYFFRELGPLSCAFTKKGIGENSFTKARQLCIGGWNLFNKRLEASSCGQKKTRCENKIFFIPPCFFLFTHILRYFFMHAAFQVPWYFAFTVIESAADWKSDQTLFLRSPIVTQPAARLSRNEKTPEQIHTTTRSLPNDKTLLLLCPPPFQK